MPRVTFVKSARKDIPGTSIKKGESYYWWKFRFGSKHTSKTYPKRSQLTQSDYLSRLYDLQDSIGSIDAGTPEELQEVRDDIVSQLEELRDEQEEKKNNMPDSLQESPTGELLQERYDQLDSAISEMEGIDLDFDEDEKSEEEWREEAIDELGVDADDEEEMKEREKEIDDKAKEMESEWQSRLDDWLIEKKDEMSGVSFE